MIRAMHVLIALLFPHQVQESTEAHGSRPGTTSCFAVSTTSALCQLSGLLVVAASAVA